MTHGHFDHIGALKELAEAWDAPGLLSGSPDARVMSIHLAVDAVAEVVDEAVELGADLLLVHHPLLLRGVTTVAESTYKGAMIARLIRGSCALVAAHTNADIVDNGVSSVIARRLGLLNEVVADIPALERRAEELARLVASHAPLTLRSTKQALQRMQPKVREDEELILMCYQSRDFREGMDAFLNKRQPQWTGE